MHRTQTAQIRVFAAVFWLVPQVHSKSALKLFNRLTMFHFKTYVLIKEAIAVNPSYKYLSPHQQEMRSVDAMLFLTTSKQRSLFPIQHQANSTPYDRSLSDIMGDAHLDCCVSLIFMSSLQEIEDAIGKLSADELAAFRVWFAEFDAKIWDRQIEEDVAASRLNKLAEQALQQLREGRCTDL
jgi:hypothetical protein